jgi:hypothetical protein
LSINPSITLLINEATYHVIQAASMAQQVSATAWKSESISQIYQVFPK